MHVTTADEYSARLVHVDKAHVRDVLENYFHGLDARDEDRLAACFMEDAVATHHYGSKSEFTLTGNTEMARYFCELMRKFAATSHARSNSAIDITGDTATAVTFATVHVLSGEHMRVRGIKYVDELARVAGSWRISKRTHIQLWQYETTTVTPHLPR